VKLQLVNDIGIPFPAHECDSIKVLLPYHSGVLEKAIDMATVKDAMIDVSLTDFELQGLKDGTGQTFWAHAKKGNQLFTFEFAKALNVCTKDGRKFVE